MVLLSDQWIESWEVDSVWCGHQICVPGKDQKEAIWDVSCCFSSKSVLPLEKKPFSHYKILLLHTIVKKNQKTARLVQQHRDTKKAKGRENRSIDHESSLGCFLHKSACFVSLNSSLYIWLLWQQHAVFITESMSIHWNQFTYYETAEHLVPPSGGFYSTHSQ